MNTWRTALVQSDETHIRIRGFDITALMRQAGFVDTIFLLHRGRLPSDAERRLLDAILVAVSDHGAGAPSCAAARLVASGNRQSISAAVAAGVLAIGDEHGGAGANCMELIAEGTAIARREGRSLQEVAGALVARAVQQRRRLPGLGHRVHTTDPRVNVLFGMAMDEGLAGDGIGFLQALQREASVRIKPLPINIDGALAALLHDMGFKPAAGKF